MRHAVLLLSVLCMAVAGRSNGSGDVVGSAGGWQQLRPSASAQEQIDATYELIGRMIGNDTAKYFTLEMLNVTWTGDDIFEIEGSTNNITLRGTSGVSLSSAFYWYLKYYCGCSISWGVNGTGDQLSLPSPLPEVPTAIQVSSPVRFRYYMNVCTVSYSGAWWNWSRWEREIDWMAMNGINLPLSFTGQEYIINEFWTSIGITQEAMDAFFAGPAFLAWGRMGNIQGWGGPLSSAWREQQYNLQLQILARQRSLGMIAVLPGFAGFLPEGVAEIFPTANITRSAGWNGFNLTYSGDYLLEPTDPLFVELGKNFTSLIMEYMGTDHIYNADTFNEMNPASDNPQYLAKASASVYNAMASADPQAVWLMQGWLFANSAFWTNQNTEAYLSGVGNDDMVILDLWAEVHPVWSRTHSFFGKPFIWCMLLNFGGNRAMFGNLSMIASGPVEANNAPHSTMIGTGLTPEAIENNPIMFELMCEMGWRDTAVFVPEWVQYYIERRYGAFSEDAKMAWNELIYGAYQDPTIPRAIIQYGPNLRMLKGPEEFGPYNATLIASAWRYLVSASLFSSGPFAYDVTDLSRQAIVNLFYDVYQTFQASFNISSTAGVKTIGPVLLDMLSDLDTLLATNPNYLLGTWIQSSMALATDETDATLFQFNARNQLTLWGPDGQISDYAAKQWSGLVGGYYRDRWSTFVQAVITSVTTQTELNTTALANEYLTMGQAFCVSTSPFPSAPIGDLQSVATTMVQRYSSPVGQWSIVNDETVVDPDSFLLPPTQVWTRDMNNLQFLCNTSPDCVGFLPDGTLLKSSHPRKIQRHAVMYLKDS